MDIQQKNRQTEHSGSVYPPTLTLRQCCHVRKLKVEGRQIFAHPSDGRVPGTDSGKKRFMEEIRGSPVDMVNIPWFPRFFKTSQVVSRISFPSGAMKYIPVFNRKYMEIHRLIQGPFSSQLYISWSWSVGKRFLISDVFNYFCSTPSDASKSAISPLLPVVAGNPTISPRTNFFQLPTLHT